MLLNSLLIIKLHHIKTHNPRGACGSTEYQRIVYAWCKNVLAIAKAQTAGRLRVPPCVVLAVETKGTRLRSAERLQTEQEDVVAWVAGENVAEAAFPVPLVGVRVGVDSHLQLVVSLRTEVPLREKEHTVK